MAINKIKTFGNVGIHNSNIELDFVNCGVITIIGKNGSGKSSYLENLVKEIKKFENGDSKNIEINKSLNKVDVITIFDNLKEVKSHLSIVANEILENIINKKETKIKMEFITNEINSYFLKEIKKFLKELKSKYYFDFEIKDLMCEDLISKFSSLDFHQWNIGDKDKNDLFHLFNTYKEMNRFVLNHSREIRALYINCIKNTDDVSLVSELKFEYNASFSEYRLKANSFFSNFLFFSILNNSNCKPSKLMKMSFEEILSLNDNQEFHKSYNDWLRVMHGQPLEFRITFSSINDTEINVEIKIIDNSSKESFLKFNDLSSGTKVVLRILSKIPNVDSYSLIILDEPETGMHPMMQIQLYEYLKKISKKTNARFIISTHSNYFIPSENTESLYICYRSKSKNSKIKDCILKANDFYLKHNMDDELQILEMNHYIPFYEITGFSKNGVNVLVEGPSDIMYLKKWAKLFGLKVNKDIQFIRPPYFSRGAAGILEGYNMLKIKLSNMNNNSLYISCDTDIETKNPKLWEEFNNKGKYFVPIGKQNSDIESLFEGKDIKYTYLLDNDESSKKRKI